MSHQSFGNTTTHCTGDNPTNLHSLTAHVRGLAHTDRRPALTHSRALTQVSHNHPTRLLRRRQVNSHTAKTAEKGVVASSSSKAPVRQATHLLPTPAPRAFMAKQ